MYNTWAAHTLPVSKELIESDKGWNIHEIKC